MSRSMSLVAVAVALAVFASSAAAQTPARTVAAQGVASVKVDAPADRTHEGPIRAAVEAAEAKALPRAIAAAREKAAELARLSGLTLGAIVSISDAPSSPFGFYGGAYGTFGPDRFCGTVRTPVFKKGADGKRHRVRTRTRRLCRVPPFVTSTVTVTFTSA